MEIRESNTAENNEIRAVHLDAFGEEEGAEVSQLAIELLEDPTAEPRLSLVAVQGGEIQGNIIFTKVSIEGAAEAPPSFILCPLAIRQDQHGSGIGTALIEKGLARLRESGAGIVLVLGDPKYYSRTGFGTDHQLEAPYPLPYPEAWQALELIEGALANTRGKVRCADCLNDPKHW